MDGFWRLIEGSEKSLLIPLGCKRREATLALLVAVPAFAGCSLVYDPSKLDRTLDPDATWVDSAVDPWSFEPSNVSLESLPAPAGGTILDCSVDIDTSTASADTWCSALDPGLLNITLADSSSTAVLLRVASLSVTGTVRVRGDRPLVIIAEDFVRIEGAIHVDADGAVAGAGAERACSTGAGTAGDGEEQVETGGGGGGGGGGFGTVGGIGGDGSSGAVGGAAGATSSALSLVPLVGGCGGGNGGDKQGAPGDQGGGGGGGGGAVQLSARNRIDIDGIVTANGGGGQPGGVLGGGGGGGSGGGLLLEAERLSISASSLVLTNGGGGGAGEGGGAGSPEAGKNGLTLLAPAPGGAGTGHTAGGDGGFTLFAGTAGGTGVGAAAGAGGGGGTGVVRVRGLSACSLGSNPPISGTTLIECP